MLREALKVYPDEGEVHYSLGLLLGEEKQLEEAAEALGTAVKLLPRRARVRYNYALALQHLGRRNSAEAALLKAHRLDTRDPSIVNALVVFYIQERRWEEALPYARGLVELVPDAPGPRQMLQQIQDVLSSGRPSSL